MEKILSAPRQFRRIETRPKKRLGMLKTLGCEMKLSFENRCSVRGTVGQSAFRLSPDEFRRIEFRSISRKPFHVETREAITEITNRFSPMNEGFVPQEEDLATEVSQKVPQEKSHVQSFEIILLQAKVKRQVPPPRRNAENRDGRNLLSAVEMMQDWGLPPGRPGPANIGDKQKTAFIEKGQMGSKCGSFFLLPASDSPASLLFPARFFPELDARVFDNSIPVQSGVARYDWDDSGLQNSCELFRQPGEWSKDRCHSQKPMGLSLTNSPSVSSWPQIVWEAAPMPSWRSDRLPLPFDRIAASEIPNLLTNPPVLIRPTIACPFSATGSRVGAAAPAASGCLEVS
jgi:hypothetical protein